MIRCFTPDDLDELRRIHSAHFENEFFEPDFLRYLCAFTVEDEKGIITFGGVRHIVECVTVTNKDRNPVDRIKALYQIMDASIFMTKKYGFDQMYVWSQNPKWAKRLRKNGFREPVGQSLILDL